MIFHVTTTIPFFLKENKLTQVYFCSKPSTGKTTEVNMKIYEITDTLCVGKRFSIRKNGEEVAHAFLYILSNDLHKEPFGFLEDVFVEEYARGEGLGKEIIKQIISFAKESGCYKLIATSRTSRDGVHEIYRKLGFVLHGKEFRMNFF
jgi:GNAT superfamily N-acetyltransferase